MKMDELEEKIMKILDDVYSDGAAMVHPDIRRKAGLILNLFSDLIKDIEWVGECDHCDNGWVLDRVGNECLKCNAIGKITRPATIEEVLEHSSLHFKSVRASGLTINNGRLRIKEEL